MKRRSFIALVLACFGVKLAAKAEAFRDIFHCTYLEWPSGTWTQLSPTFESLEIASPPVYLGEVMEQDVTEIRMDQAGDTARKWLADQLWYDIKRNKFP